MTGGTPILGNLHMLLGTPKSSISMGFSLQAIHLGVPPFLEPPISRPSHQPSSLATSACVHILGAFTAAVVYGRGAGYIYIYGIKKIPLVNQQFAIEHGPLMVDLPIKVVIFHSNVSLPEGNRGLFDQPKSWCSQLQNDGFNQHDDSIENQGCAPVCEV